MIYLIEPNGELFTIQDDVCFQDVFLHLWLLSLVVVVMGLEEPVRVA